MSRSGCLEIVAVLLAAMLVRAAVAQTPADEAAAGSQATSSVSNPYDVGAEVSTSKQEPKVGDDQPVQYATSLDGTGLVALDGGSPSHLLYGATIAGGWDSNPVNTSSSVGSGLFTISPYLGLRLNTPKTQTLLQYQSTNTRFTSDYAEQTMNTASAKVLSRVNDRWSWDLNTLASHGRDAIRFLGSQQTVAVGEVPGTGPNSESYLADAGTVTSVESAGGLRYRKSERDTLELRVADGFNRYSGLKESNSIATVKLNYDRDLSPRSGLFAYGQSSFYYGALQCESYGGGVGARWKPSERTSLLLSAGPQLNTRACASQQGYAYNVAFSSRVSGSSQIYLLSAREPTTSYLGPGLFQKSVSGGYQRRVVNFGSVSADVGYVTSDTLSTTSSYGGTYFDCIYNRRLSPGLQASYSYRQFAGNSGGTHFGRHVAAFSLVWTPAAGRTVQ